MALAFKTTTVNFDPTSGQLQSEPGHATFSSRVRVADVAIKGFVIGYTDGDHHVLTEEVRVHPGSVSVTGPTVDFRVDFLIRDSSGNIDDRYGGSVDVLVMADLA